MPQSPIASGGSSMDLHTTVNAWVTYPFRDQGDPSTRVYHHQMIGALATYQPLADDNTLDGTLKPARSPFPDDPAAFYVGDENPTPLDGGLISYTRVFANIPQDRYDPGGLYAFDFPGVASSETSTETERFSFIVNAVTINTSSSTYRNTTTLSISCTITSGDTSKLGAGATVQVNFGGAIYYQYRHTQYDAAVSRSDSSYMKTVGSYGTFTVSASFTKYQTNAMRTWTGSLYESHNLSGGSFTYTYSKIDTTPGSFTAKNSIARIYKTYIKTNDPTNVTLADKTVLPSSLSDTTSPSLSDYEQWVREGRYLIGAPETIEQWRGNIYERSQIQVRAIT